jgi:inosose dehydratase
MTTNRRSFLQSVAAISAVPLLLSFKNEEQKPFNFPISCNAYNWFTFYGRQNKKWGEDLDKSMADLAKTGITAYEPGLESAEDVKHLAPFLKKYNISMPSVYVNSVLHKIDEAEKSIATVLSIADEVVKLGTKIVVTNPSPIKWGGPEIKSDAELSVQAKSMEKLGMALRKKGLTLAYHTHDVELRAGAKEFHHVLQNTTPENVSFCFDTHWVYRGSMDSQLAVFDVLKMYGNRVVELHLRQSVNGVWSETFGTGDIDYQRFANELKATKLRPHLVIEQCIEAKTPNTMDGVTAHIKDLAMIKEVFKGILG